MIEVETLEGDMQRGGFQYLKGTKEKYPKRKQEKSPGHRYCPKVTIQDPLHSILLLLSSPSRQHSKYYIAGDQEKRKDR